MGFKSVYIVLKRKARYIEVLLKMNFIKYLTNECG